MRTDRGGWCGCGDHNYHIEWHHDKGICMRTDVGGPDECDKGKEIPMKWKVNFVHTPATTTTPTPTTKERHEEW